MRHTIFTVGVVSIGLAATITGAEGRLRSAQLAQLHSSVGAVPLSAGASIIDKGTLNCPSGRTCKIGVSATAIVSNGGATNPWSICATVDGQAASPPCATQPDSPADHPVTGTYLQVWKVNQGDHRLTLQIDVSGPATLEGWSVVYQEYPD